MHRTSQRNCPKRGTSNAPSMNLAGIRSTIWAKKEPFDFLWGYAASASETFQTVSASSTLAI
jgi:hypothetical protein